jgi:hypothetical protein
VETEINGGKGNPHLTNIVFVYYIKCTSSNVMQSINNENQNEVYIYIHLFIYIK